MLSYIILCHKILYCYIILFYVVLYCVALYFPTIYCNILYSICYIMLHIFSCIHIFIYFYIHLQSAFVECNLQFVDDMPSCDFILQI